MPYRFVGSYEYAKAVENFEQLVLISTPEELAAYDKVLNGRPEFTYFNGANVMLDVPVDLKKANPKQRTQFFDTFRKKGLAWMMALAKVELNATASMYGDAPKPFQSIRVTEYDIVPYMNVLADDAIAHLKSLSMEKGFRDVTQSGRTVDTWTIAYLRRLKMIRDMLSTLSEIGNAEVKARIQPYDAKLRMHEKKLVSNIKMQTRTTSKNKVNKSYRSSNETNFEANTIRICLSGIKKTAK